MSAFGNNPVVYLVRKIWRFSEGNRPLVVLYFLMFVISSIISFLQPLVMAFIMNKIQLEGVSWENFNSYLWWLALLIAVDFGFWAFHGPARILETRNAFLLRANLKKYLLDGTMGLKAQWHTDHHSGDTIDKVEKACTSMYSISSRGFEVIQTVMQFISSFLAVLYFDLSAGGVIVLLMMVTLTLIMRFDKILIKQWSELFKAENRISAAVYDALSNITTVIILRIENLVSKSIFAQIMNPYSLAMKNYKLNEAKWFLVAMFASVTAFFVVLLFIYNNLSAGNIILVGTIFALTSYIDRINRTFFRFAYLYSDIVRAKTSVENSEALSDEFQTKTIVKPIDLNGNWKKLKIDNLKFSYHSEEGAHLHLDNISMEIKRGQKIALIGESGSGKTTFLKIIRELYEPQSLSLYLDEKLLKQNFKAISANIALIPQDPEIFNTTIRENITVGVPHKLPFIKRFSDLASFTGVAEALPHGFESSIVEKGVNLSGGEKQRLALARGLLASLDKAILLLDEPTSSVDFRNELRIYKKIFREFKDKTIISSIHRLHLLSMFDNIYFFRHGKVLASGNLEELRLNCKDFQKIWKNYQDSHKGKGDFNMDEKVA